MMEWQASVGKAHYRIAVTETENNHLQILIGDKTYLVDVTTPTPKLYSLLIEGKSYLARVEAGQGTTLLVTVGQHTVPVEILEKQHLLRSKKTSLVVSGRQEITAPMTGRVVDVFVKEGEQVDEGKPLLIMEAMKMETEIRSPITGTVKELQIQQNMAVEIGQLLMIIE
jgi:oxaloacetate decarboxylase alpha subunit